MFSTYSKNPQHRCMQWRNGASETRSGTYLSVWLWGEGILFFAASWYLKRCLVVFQTMHCDTGLTSREVGRAQVRSILAPAGDFHFWFIVVVSAFRRFLSNMFHPLRCSGSQVCRIYCFPTYLRRLVKKSAPQHILLQRRPTNAPDASGA